MTHTKNAWVTCWECKGKRFDEDNRLCKMCGGDGCVHKSTIIKLLDGHAPDTLLADITSVEPELLGRCAMPNCENELLAIDRDFCLRCDTIMYNTMEAADGK